jgi:hypothetical protein
VPFGATRILSLPYAPSLPLLLLLPPPSRCCPAAAASEKEEREPLGVAAAAAAHSLLSTRTGAIWRHTYPQPSLCALSTVASSAATTVPPPSRRCRWREGRAGASWCCRRCCRTQSTEYTHRCHLAPHVSSAFPMRPLYRCFYCRHHRPAAVPLLLPARRKSGSRSRSGSGVTVARRWWQGLRRHR